MRSTGASTSFVFSGRRRFRHSRSRAVSRPSASTRSQATAPRAELYAPVSILTRTFLTPQSGKSRRSFHPIRSGGLGDGVGEGSGVMSGWLRAGGRGDFGGRRRGLAAAAPLRPLQGADGGDDRAG